MISFLLAKPTQFDAPFFRWMHANRPDMPFVVFYWQPIGNAADTDSETGASLIWGIDLLADYPWQQVDPGKPVLFQKKLRQLGVSYMICNGWKKGFKLLIKAAKRQRIPLGLRIDSVAWGKSKLELDFRRWLLAKAYQPFSQFYSAGTITDQYLRMMKIPSMRWRRWPYCTDIDFFKKSPEHEREAEALKAKWGLEQKPVFVGICKWVDRENPLELLTAFIGLNNPELQLVMIGDGPLRPQMEALRDKHPHLKICFPGYVPYVSLPGWYALATVFVHPASYEPWGVSVQEAMAAGCFVIASSRVGSSYDLLLQGVNGFQYRAGDAQVLTKCLQEVLQLDPHAMQQFNEEILAKWNYESVAAGLVLPETSY